MRAAPVCTGAGQYAALALKLGVWIESSVRRIVLHLPMKHALAMRMTGGASLALSVPCPHSQSPRAKCSTAISASPERAHSSANHPLRLQNHDHSAFTPMAPTQHNLQAVMCLLLNRKKRKNRSCKMFMNNAG